MFTTRQPKKQYFQVWQEGEKEKRCLKATNPRKAAQRYYRDMGFARAVTLFVCPRCPKRIKPQRIEVTVVSAWIRPMRWV